MNKVIIDKVQDPGVVCSHTVSVLVGPYSPDTAMLALKIVHILRKEYPLEWIVQVIHDSNVYIYWTLGPVVIYIKDIETSVCIALRITELVNSYTLSYE